MDSSSHQLPARYADYLRVSTEEQASSGAGLAAQRQALDRAFDYEGWGHAGTFRDEGLSGSTLERPGLRAALEAIAAGEADGLVVAKLDRLTRSVLDFSELLEWFADAGAALVALDLKIDTSSPTGAMIANVFIAVAEWERRTIAERTRNALAAKRELGELTGRPAVGDDEELLARIRELAGEDLSLHAIARALTEEGWPTVRGGAKWRASSVQTALGYERPKTRRKRSALPDIPKRRRT